MIDSNVRQSSEWYLNTLRPYDYSIIERDLERRVIVNLTRIRWTVTVRFTENIYVRFMWERIIEKDCYNAWLL